MQVVNTDPDADDTALNLTVQPEEAPVRVTSDTKVGNLNADKLDGQDSGAFVRNDVYKAESLVDAGIQKADGTFVKTQGCEGNDVLLNGGPANVNASSDLLESFPAPASTNTWQARINTNGSADNYSVVVLCARQ